MQSVTYMVVRDEVKCIYMFIKINVRLGPVWYQDLWQKVRVLGFGQEKELWHLEFYLIAVVVS